MVGKQPGATHTSRPQPSSGGRIWPRARVSAPSWARCPLASPRGQLSVTPAPQEATRSEPGAGGAAAVNAPASPETELDQGCSVVGEDLGRRLPGARTKPIASRRPEAGGMPTAGWGVASGEHPSLYRCFCFRPRLISLPPRRPAGSQTSRRVHSPGV